MIQKVEIMLREEVEEEEEEEDGKFRKWEK